MSSARSWFQVDGSSLSGGRPASALARGGAAACLAAIALSATACVRGLEAHAPPGVDSESDGLACVEAALRADPPEYTLSAASSQFEQRCDKRDEPGACSALGVMHELGRGADKDVERAARLYERACDRGHARACLNLGRLYARGEGVPVVASHAVVLFDLACAGGSRDGCNALARATLNGEGTAQSNTRGAALLEEACRAEHAPSCVDLGELYERGETMARDPGRAERLYADACRWGDVTGCFKLDQIGLARMTDGSLGAAPAWAASSRPDRSALRVARGSDQPIGDARE